MTRCEEFSRGEYAPRLLAYFLFLKSLLHEITQENQLKIDPKIPKIKKLKRSLVSHRLDSYSLFLSTRHEEFSKVSSVNGSRTKTTLLLGSSAKSPGIPFFLPREERSFAWRKEAHFPRHTRLCKWVHFLWKLTILSLHSSLLNPCNDSLFLISMYILKYRIHLLSDY